MPRAREAAEKALRLDPSMAEAHTWLGAVHWWYDYDYAAARREFERARKFRVEREAQRALEIHRGQRLERIPIHERQIVIGHVFSVRVQRGNDVPALCGRDAAEC